MIRAALALLSAAVPSVAETPHPSDEPPESGARERLRKALAEVTRAEGALADARAHLQRVEETINAADEADAALERAEAAATQAARDWATSGANGAQSSPAYDQAARARNAAYTARLQADGAKAALREIETRERDALTDLENALTAARSAAIGVANALVEPQIAELERARASYHESLASLAALIAIQNPKWGHIHPWYGLRTDASNALAARVRALAVEVPQEAALREASQSWADFAERLLKNPEARL
jgi:hypothetical protein